MKKSGLIAIVVLLILAVVVISTRDSGRETLYVYNWGDYIDEDVLEIFEKEFDVRVVYDTYTTNEDMYVKVSAGGSNYDLICPSDYMIKRMIDEDLLETLNHENIPNYKYIDNTFVGLEHDPKNEYSVPYMWGTLGILYNKNMVQEPVTSWDVLWDPQYSKEILMLDSVRDTLGLTLKMLGYSLNSMVPAELNAAKEKLIAQKPLVLAYVVDEAKDKMVAGEAAMAIVYSGDAIYAIKENENLGYAIPQEGTNLWFDGWAIPKTTQNKELAEKFIDFLNRPEIAYRNADYIGYSSPHIEAAKQLQSEVVDQTASYPDDEVLENAEVFIHVGNMLREYDKIWTEIKAY